VAFISSYLAGRSLYILVEFVYVSFLLFVLSLAFNSDYVPFMLLESFLVASDFDPFMLFVSLALFVTLALFVKLTLFVSLD
jgi:hypothetical protein